MKYHGTFSISYKSSQDLTQKYALRRLRTPMVETGFFDLKFFTYTSGFWKSVRCWCVMIHFEVFIYQRLSFNHLEKKTNAIPKNNHVENLF